MILITGANGVVGRHVSGNSPQLRLLAGTEGADAGERVALDPIRAGVLLKQQRAENAR